MNGNPSGLEDRMQQLLSDRATEGLDAAEASELDLCLASHPAQDEDDFERAAAAINLATLPPVSDSLPSALRDRILFEAGRFFGMTQNQQHVRRTAHGRIP